MKQENLIMPVDQPKFATLLVLWPKRQNAETAQ